MGDIKFPNKIPNLNQILFNGVSSFDFRSPKTKKINPINKDHVLISPSFSNGKKLIIVNTAKKTKPKLLFEEILMLLFIKLLVTQFKTPYKNYID